MRTKYQSQPSMDERLALVSVKLPTSMLDGLDQAAKYQLCSRSQVIRTAILAELRRQQAGTEAVAS